MIIDPRPINSPEAILLAYVIGAVTAFVFTQYGMKTQKTTQQNKESL